MRTSEKNLMTLHISFKLIANPILQLTYYNMSEKFHKNSIIIILNHKLKSTMIERITALMFVMYALY